MIDVSFTGARFKAAAAVLVTSSLLTACGAANEVNAEGPATTAASVTTSKAASAAIPSPDEAAGSTQAPAVNSFPESAQILAQYHAFFSAITPISLEPDAAARAAAMAKLAVDPEYTTLLSGLKASRDAARLVTETTYCAHNCSRRPVMKRHWWTARTPP